MNIGGEGVFSSGGDETEKVASCDCNYKKDKNCHNNSIFLFFSLLNISPLSHSVQFVAAFLLQSFQISVASLRRPVQRARLGSVTTE